MHGATTTETTKGARLRSIDLLRGVAILGMVAVHAVQVPGVADWFVSGPGRLVMPLFMLVAGALSAGRVPSMRRYFEVMAAAVASVPLAWVLELAFAPILLVFWIVWPLVWLSRDPLYLSALGSLSLLQAYSWPLGWAGYEPGAVLACLCFGGLCAKRLLSLDLPSFPLVEFVGRYPLTFYLSHLYLILIATRLPDYF